MSVMSCFEGQDVNSLPALLTTSSPCWLGTHLSDSLIKIDHLGQTLSISFNCHNSPIGQTSYPPWDPGLRQFKQLPVCHTTTGKEIQNWNLEGELQSPLPLLFEDSWKGEP